MSWQTYEKLDQTKQVESPRQHAGLIMSPKHINVGTFKATFNISYHRSHRANGFEEFTMGSLWANEAGQFGMTLGPLWDEIGVTLDVRAHLSI